MTAAQIPFNKSAVIYKSQKFIFIEALSGASALMYREDNGHRVYLEADASDTALGEALLAALDRSRLVDLADKEFYDPRRASRVYANWQREFADRHGHKSKRAAFENVDRCDARISDGQILIRPNRRDKPGSWGSLPPEKTVVIPATRDAATVGAALKLALDRCE
jgi:CDI immunity protein